MSVAVTINPLTLPVSNQHKLSETARYLCVPEGIVSTGFGRIETVANRLGIYFDPWQQGLGRLMYAKRADGKYAASIGGNTMSIGRQVGKTFLTGVSVTITCASTPNTFVIWTAHRTRTSDETFRNLQAIIGKNGIRQHVQAVRRGNGQQAILFNNGSRILFGAREQGFGRGFDKVDIMIFDEAQILTEKALDDMLPAMNASPNGLLFFMGTPPRPIDPGEVFAHKRDQALDGDKDTMYIEFSADRDADTRDRDQWAKANPSYPYRTKDEAMLRMLKNLGEDSFRREALGIWDENATHQAINLDQWSATLVDQRREGGWVAMGIDMTPDRSTLTIGACMAYQDGTAHVELAQLKPTKTYGTQWAVQWIAQRWNKLAAVVIDAQSPATVLLPELKKAGVTVTLTGPKDMGQACGRLLDMVSQRTITHLTGQTPLEQAVEGATIRPIGHEGAFGWNKLGSDIDISPLVAVTLALHGAMTSTRRPTNKPQRILMLP